MRGIESKHIGVRSFRLKGLTARWGIDGDRPPMPPALRTALVAWYNTEIQRATNFDVIESYLLNMNTGVLYPENAAATVSGQKLRITNVVNTYTAVYKVIASVAGAELVLHVIGLSSTIRARVVAIDNKGHRLNCPLTNGVNKVQGAASGFTSFIFEGLTAGACDITVEQLPTSKLTDLSGNGHHLHLYGFTGSDNIVDNMLQHTGTQYGVSYGQPILTDYTVCSTREWINPANDNVFASKSSAPGNGAFIFEYIPNSTYSFGIETIAALTVPNGFSYQTKTSYNGIKALKVGTGLDTDHLVVGRIRLNDQPRSFHGGYKSFVLFNRTLTTEELAYVERWMA